MNEIGMCNDNDKHFGKIEKNTSNQHCGNGLYNTRLCGSNMV